MSKVSNNEDITYSDVVIEDIERLRNSGSGNPRFAITFWYKTTVSGVEAAALKTLHTKANSSISYEIVPSQLLDRHANLTITYFRGNEVIVDIEKIEA